MSLFSGPQPNPLNTTAHILMQAAMEQTRDSLVAAGSSNAQRLALMVVALTGFENRNDHPWAGIRTDEEDYSASLLKVAAMYAAFDLRSSADQLATDNSLTAWPDIEAALMHFLDSSSNRLTTVELYLMAEEVKPRRRYRSSARTRQREATRAAIVEAATAAFIENGYAATTIAQIAARADVSPETVYAVFGTKRDVLRAVVERASAGAPSTDAWRTGAWLARVKAEPNQRRRLELITDATRDVLRRGAPINEIVRSVAASDPEIAELQRELECRQRSDLRGLVQLLAEAGPLRVSIDDAVDLWWALGHSTGPYRLLTVDRRWSDRRARAALSDVVARALLDDS